MDRKRRLNLNPSHMSVGVCEGVELICFHLCICGRSCNFVSVGDSDLLDVSAWGIWQGPERKTKNKQPLWLSSSGIQGTGQCLASDSSMHLCDTTSLVVSSVTNDVLGRIHTHTHAHRDKEPVRHKALNLKNKVIKWETLTSLHHKPCVSMLGRKHWGHSRFSIITTAQHLSSFGGCFR